MKPAEWIRSLKIVNVYFFFFFLRTVLDLMDNFKNIVSISLLIYKVMNINIGEVQNDDLMKL